MNGARLAESSLPGFELASWNGILTPAGTPGTTVSKLNSEIRKTLNHADVKSRLTPDSADPAPGLPTVFAALIKSELAKYAKVVVAANIKAN